MVIIFLKFKQTTGNGSCLSGCEQWNEQIPYLTERLYLWSAFHRAMESRNGYWDPRHCGDTYWLCRYGPLHVGCQVKGVTSHLMFLKGWKWQKNVAMGTGHQHVKTLGIFKSLRWYGNSASCGRGEAHLFVPWGFKQGFGGQWLVSFFPFGTDIFPCHWILRGGRGSQGGRRLWCITAEFQIWLASKNFCQFMGCTAFILLKESMHNEVKIGITPSCMVCCDLQQIWIMGRDSGHHLTGILQLNTCLKKLQSEEPRHTALSYIICNSSEK